MTNTQKLKKELTFTVSPKKGIENSLLSFAFNKKNLKGYHFNKNNITFV